VEWLRSVTLLGVGFVAVVVVTLGLAGWLVPQRGTSAASAGASPGASAAAAQPTPLPGSLGGVLVVSGDRTGSLTLNRMSDDGSNALLGSDGRVQFGGDPLAVTQVSYDGLDFFPDADACTITPGDVNEPAGVAEAHLACTGLADIRESGVIAVEGTVGLPADLLVGRQTPPTGGSVSLGPETWTFEFGYLFSSIFPTPHGDVSSDMELFDEGLGTALLFLHDEESGRYAISGLSQQGEVTAVPDGACTVGREQIGRPNPTAVTVQLTIDCASVEVPGLGAVPISGTVVIDELEGL
jgi:hypothetical protein